MLRKCRTCGKVANTVEDLELFEKGKRYKYGRKRKSQQVEMFIYSGYLLVVGD
jgi:hypothetical protein